ncbi:MAG: tryptophan--tRNA ligase [Chloroflexi bacterium]|nr:tryptophan--tRNA ligase [Chloroflexota bacterium]
MTAKSDTAGSTGTSGTSGPVERVLSGIQPSGVLHIGNYFGAIKQHLEYQEQYAGEAFYFIADYHALTTVRDPEEMARLVRGVALDYLALGLDPGKATFYRQSDLPEVCELTWILGCVTGKGLLDRAVSFKDKVQQGIAASAGLYMYPLLQAADILIVRSTIVPVGQDQAQHLEITRDIAGSFNAAYDCTLFPGPKTMLNDAAVVPGMDGQKMSKSYDNTVPIFASEDEIVARVKRVKTSSTPLGEPIDPDTDIVYQLYRLFASQEDGDAMRRAYQAGDMGYGTSKGLLQTAMASYFEPYRDRRHELEGDLDYVEDVLQQGVKRAREEARQTMELVRERVGLDSRAMMGAAQ